MRRALTPLGKLVLLAVFLVVVAITGFFWLNQYIYEEKQAYAARDYRDAEYIFSGERVRLKDGVGETENLMGAASKTVVRYFGNEVRADLNQDGREDVAFLVTQETGGSGTFYYAVGALNTERGYVGSEAVLIGDRIAPQSTNVDARGFIVVNYADRKPGEPFTTSPSLGKSLYLKFDPAAMQFGEVVQDFEGESDGDNIEF